MKNTLLLLIFCCTCFSTLSGQQVTETMLGDSGWNNPQKVWQMPDGNIAVVSGRFAGNSVQVKLYHLNTSGEVLAAYDLPPQGTSSLIAPAADGASFHYGHLDAAGYTISHLDLQGQIMSCFSYSPPDPIWDDYFFASRPAPNGDFVLAIKDQDPPMGIRVVRLNPQGNVVFNRYTSSSDPELNNTCLCVLPDGRSVLALLDFSQGYRMISYSATGAQQWSKGLMHTPVAPDEMGLVPLDNGNVVFFGQQAFNGNNWVSGFVTVYKPDGNFAFDHTFENDLPNFEPFSVFADGDQIVVAGRYDLPLEIGFGVVKLDAAGNTLFAKKFPLLSGDGNTEAALTQNGDYIFSGAVWKQTSPGTFNSDKGYVLCLQPDGTLNWLIPGTSESVRLMNNFCQLSNGDAVFCGQSFAPQGPAGSINSLIFQVSGLGPAYSHLVAGNIVLDSNGNCLPEANEPNKIGWIVKADGASGSRFAVTDGQGNYRIRLKDDAATVTAKAPNNLWESCAATYPVAFSNADTISLPILVKAVALCPFLSLDASTNFLRRCFDNTYHFYWCNNGSATTEGLALNVHLDTFTTFVSASLPLTAQTGQTLTFSPQDLAPGECREMTLTIHISCQAPIGQLHCLSASLQAANTCPDVPGSTGTARECLVNVGSFDPNDKRAFVGDTLQEGNILPNTDIRYQIRFQNTGTDTAINIVVIDTIPGALDGSTLRVGAASHPFSFQLQGNQVAKFIFNNIQLPDSNINEVASHGFVNFTIAQKPELPLLTQINNKANIYFDFNSPVGTNEHHLLVNKTSATGSPNMTVTNIRAYPNPAEAGEIWLETNDPAGIIQQVQILDALGKQHSVLQPHRNRIRVSLPDPGGLYFLRVLTDHGGWQTIKTSR